MNRQTILKNFTIGFIPLLIFIIADELYGTKIGLISAISVGIAEFMYYYLRYKLVEKFILFDVILIIALGGVSLLLDNEIFFKLKPALIESILVILLGVHAFSEKPVLLMLGKRYLKNMEINQMQLNLMRQLSRILFILFLGHTLLIVYSAYFMSKEAWAFISGGLFYIIFGIILAGQFVYLKFFKNKKIKYEAREGEEWFDLVDEKGKITGKAPRSAVHGNPDLLHPVVHVHIFNKNGQLYLQKRSKSKDVQPGKWDTAVGGHINSGEDVMSALKREAMEELGIKSDNFQPLYRYVMRNEFESELVHTFRLNYNGPFKINRDEIEFGRFWRMSEIEKNLGKGIFTPNFEQEFQMLQSVSKKKKSK
jgi:isopentenyldiphosphate isomerase/intracellular septation protein A